MFIAYFDETGDDGFPEYSSPAFVLTSITVHHQDWKSVYECLHAFRKILKDRYDFPVKIELHTRDFLRAKGAYHAMGYPETERLEILKEYAHNQCLSVQEG
ncbi:hypothetical protein AUK40_01850 [Candidatus Wirthbacteria bacterium CG2_30_54_11]|uniref:DUF3800 domain-containing protein n=1 Tax=Candidatus Wirthbacteria bacterium CG2_30_54_11 TaxID=1817892 RepID=A0A1J5IUV1_9BACT|nr:MAG: hypothetical protein AUK40_01850 [Candidatus Wirthbacteria bacterium CG2_30_54_11]